MVSSRFTKASRTKWEILVSICLEQHSIENDYRFTVSGVPAWSLLPDSIGTGRKNGFGALTLTQGLHEG